MIHITGLTENDSLAHLIVKEKEQFVIFPSTKEKRCQQSNLSFNQQFSTAF